jgi:type II secretory pathway component PulF
MPNFRYSVRDRSGKAIAGTIDAATLQNAGERLYQLGYFPIKVEEEGKAVSIGLPAFWKRFQKAKLEDLIFFSQQLSTLYKAGLPLLAGLKSLMEQTECRRLKPVFEGIYREIEGGNTLFGAMSKYPDVYPPVYLNLIHAGEASGMLGESLDRFVILADRELRSRQRVKEATRYPKMVIGALGIAFAVLVTFVIPRFAEVFARFNTPLPLPTRVMIGINNVFHTYWYLFLCPLIGLPLLFRHYISSEKGKVSWDRLKTRIPMLGPIFLKIALTRFTYIFVMLNRSGVPILQTLEITSTGIENAPLAESIKEIALKVKEGKSLTEAMREIGKFTPLIIQMVSVGEASGTLDKMLMQVTEYYDREVENGIKRLSTYVEPALTILLGILVLLLALAIFLPWWNMASLFR